MWFFADIAVRVYLGVHGNLERETKLIARGFDYETTVNAPNGEVAVVIYAKQQT